MDAIGNHRDPFDTRRGILEDIRRYTVLSCFSFLVLTFSFSLSLSPHFLFLYLLPAHFSLFLFLTDFPLFTFLSSLPLLPSPSLSHSHCLLSISSSTISAVFPYQPISSLYLSTNHLSFYNFFLSLSPFLSLSLPLPPFHSPSLLCLSYLLSSISSSLIFTLSLSPSLSLLLIFYLPISSSPIPRFFCF